MKRQIPSILILLLMLSCELDKQKSVPIHKNSDNSSDVTKKVPKRSEILKEENVLDDKVLYITGSDIYLNSSFIRSILPTDKFPKFARDENLLERQQYVDNSWLDYWAKEFYDPQNELEQGVISDTKEFADINSYIFNQFGLSEATVKVEVFPAREDMTSYYKVRN